MKFSTMMAVCAVSLAFVAAGCKYDKVGEGDGPNGPANGDFAGQPVPTDAGKGGIDEKALRDAQAAKDAMGGKLGDIAAGARFEDIYQRCTDVNFQPVYFGFDSTTLAPAELSKIDEVVRHLRANANRVVVIEGHCDERGSIEYNLSLGENRAMIVSNYLQQNGITPDRIQTRSYGEEKPAVDGHDESAWRMNRRGEFAIFQK